ncbi:uncharacterized protein V6R79_001260 [Siganus canaliculatus]
MEAERQLPPEESLLVPSHTEAGSGGRGSAESGGDQDQRREESAPITRGTARGNSCPSLPGKSYCCALIGSNELSIKQADFDGHFEVWDFGVWTELDRFNLHQKADERFGWNVKDSGKLRRQW